MSGPERPPRGSGAGTSSRAEGAPPGPRGPARGAPVPESVLANARPAGARGSGMAPPDSYEVLDEVQRVPALLDERDPAHRDRGTALQRFSARARGSSAGRLEPRSPDGHLRKAMHPLTPHDSAGTSSQGCVADAGHCLRSTASGSTPLAASCSRQESGRARRRTPEQRFPHRGLTLQVATLPPRLGVARSRSRALGSPGACRSCSVRPAAGGQRRPLCGRCGAKPSAKRPAVVERASGLRPRSVATCDDASAGPVQSTRLPRTRRPGGRPGRFLLPGPEYLAMRHKSENRPRCRCAISTTRARRQARRLLELREPRRSRPRPR